MARKTLEQRLLRDVERTVERVLSDRLGHVLDDVGWRIGQMLDMAGGRGQVLAENLNLQQHMLTGYTLTNNSPSAGYIAWADLRIVYQGTEYGPFAGNTNLQYTWFDFDHATQKIQSSATKPTLAKEDTLLFINDAGTGTVVPGNTMQHGAAILSGSVKTGELAAGAVTETILGSGAVSTTKLATGAVTDTILAANAVTSGKIATDAVTATHIAGGAVGSTEIASSAVGETQLASGAVTSTKIGSGAVTSTAIAGGAVGTTQLANSAVDGTKLATDAVGSAHIATGAVGSTEVASGAISTTKLNILQHMIF